MAQGDEKSALSLVSEMQRLLAPALKRFHGRRVNSTGDGLLLALRQAQALATALEDGRLASYARAHRLIMRRPIRMARLLLTMDRWPAFGRRALGTLARSQALFRELLAIHVGARARPAVLAVGFRLGYRLLAHGGADDPAL